MVSNDDGGLLGLLAALTRPRALLYAVGLVFVAGAASTYFGAWTSSDVQPKSDEVVGAALLYVGEGLFVGVGLLGVVAAVVLIREASSRAD